MYHYTIPPNLTYSGYQSVSLLFHKKINHCRILMVNEEIKNDWLNFSKYVYTQISTTIYI